MLKHPQHYVYLFYLLYYSLYLFHQLNFIIYEIINNLVLYKYLLRMYLFLYIKIIILILTQIKIFLNPLY